MDELERKLFEDIQKDLDMYRLEKQRLSDRLDYLIIMLRRAWQGNEEAAEALSDIVGIPAPKIIPSKEDINSNEQLSQEYLQITSALLDEQLKEDSNLRKAIRTLQPPSSKPLWPARVRSASQRPKSSRLSRQNKTSPRHGEYGVERTSHRKKLNVSAAASKEDFEAADNLAMTEIADILSMLSSGKSPEKLFQTKRLMDAHEQRNSFPRRKPSDMLIHESMIGPRKSRPLSAALQQRQDYLRAQTRGRKPRPHTAKPAFRFAEVDDNCAPRSYMAYHTPVAGGADYQNKSFSSPRERPPLSLRDFDDAAGPRGISVDISKKSFNSNSNHQVVTANRSFFPHERDCEPLGDVADGLQRLQEMQRQFKRNSKRLQEKIGISDAGIV